MTAAWLRFQAGTARLTLQIHAQPNARTTGAAGLYGDSLKVRIAASAVDGRANLVLLNWLASVLNVPRSVLTLKSGATSRRKLVEIRPADSATAARAALLAEV